MRAMIRSFLAEPRPEGAPEVRALDWVLVILAILGAVLGAVFEPDIGWRPLAMVLGCGFAFALLTRRSHPLSTLAVAFAVQAVVDVATIAAGEDGTLLASTGVVSILLTYSVVRWGSGREATLGVAIVLSTQVLTNLAAGDIGEYLVSLPFWLLVIAVAIIMRTRAAGRARRIAEVRAGERHRLARELHDTVAHHVSAIAIQAQAGRALADRDPDAAVEVLAVIEDAASKTLSEMRQMVSALREDDDAADTAPQADLRELERLVAQTGAPPQVELELHGDLDDLGPTVEAGLYRMAQESITNARRHARHATRIHVHVEGTADAVTLCVTDDGDARPTEPADRGFGLVGMAERASLLGGTLAAGPDPVRGWRVTAVLPRPTGGWRP